ncbi:acyl-CoA dehydrogenase family protein [Actinokineospora sp. G85]|uniref:acyl-CoA dehydrogenase family protein n=1 Tax=Actinokineospora sp. G85 TaxID=3406626 RepID=UPI003C729D38
MADLVERARWVADTVLFPDADAVDRDGTVPESHFRVLAAEGFYGLAVRQDLELPVMLEVLEVLAGGCLTTTFTWIQHHGVVIGVARGDNDGLKERLLPGLTAGTTRGGVAFAGALATPPRLTAERVEGGWALTGDAPFVSGWGIVDVLQVSAVAGDQVVKVVVDAAAAPGLSPTRLDLIAAQGTATVRLVFDGLFVPDDRVAGVQALSSFQDDAVFGSRLNGCLAMGLTRRAADLLDDLGRVEEAAAFREAAAQARAALDTGLTDLAAMLRARAGASELAYRAAGAVVVAEGARGVAIGGHGQRLVREATFTLVAASRAPIKDDLLRRLSER